MGLKWKRPIGILLIVAGAYIAVAVIVHGLFYNPQKEVVPVDTATLQNSFIPSGTDYPITLIIPKIHVDTNIQKVGITFKGNMSTPNNYADVGWYKYGTVPGNIGSSVIAGHVDNGFGLDGVFKHLNELAIGDDVYVLMNEGRTLHYKVVDLETYDYLDGPTKEIFNDHDIARLNLITCAGVWVPEAQTNDKRLVVYTTLST